MTKPTHTDTQAHALQNILHFPRLKTNKFLEAASGSVFSGETGMKISCGGWPLANGLSQPLVQGCTAHKIMLGFFLGQWQKFKLSATLDRTVKFPGVW
jgi:hypothetical protein